ncbi:Transcription factor tau subunit sfc4 [Lecanosticta acicola]|uniref:Transcription factor tau subunit sfc4 n=1 Tax=Lecanosticta acicola TaxID=111012 RepID=A0AAI8YWW3_9PEZI|nr:Transcription factor tau subunit sfc4 [Lecanosticta acicola]
MEQSNSNRGNATNGSASTALLNYPDPSQGNQTPYPVLQKPPSYGPFPGSTRGLLPASHAASSYGAVPGSQAQSYHGRETRQHMNGFGPLSATDSEPPHLAPTNLLALPASTQLTPTQRLAQQFQVRHGDPGDRSVGLENGLLPQDGERCSEYAGIWHEDTGGKAAQSAAFHAAIRNGEQYQWDPDASSARDPEIDALFEAEELASRGSRGRPRGRGRGRSRGYKSILKELDARVFPEQKKRGRGGSRGRPRGRGRGRGGRRSKAIDPGPEFKKYLQLANKAYVDGVNEEAADYARQAIQANPEVWQAHSLLAQILELQGRDEDAVNAMKWGATCSKEPEVWIRTAEKILEVAGDRRTRQALRDAVDCYGEVLKLTRGSKSSSDGEDDLELQVRMTMIELFKELHETKSCRMHCRSILRHHPGNTVILREYAMLAGQWQDPGDMRVAQEAYEKAFEFYRDAEEFGAEDDGTDQFSHLNIYLDLVEMRGNPAEGIYKGKQLARRFLGRQDETFWERYVDDDREFDDGNERRIEVGEFQQGRASRDMMKYGHGLPIEIKVKFGCLRMRMGQGHFEEARKHFRPLLQYADEIEEYHDMFTTVASSLRKSGFMTEAAEYYDCVRNVPNADHPDYGLSEDVWMQMGTCYQALERQEDAVACLEAILARKGDKYALACARLAKLYEDIGDNDKARLLANELIMLNRRDLLHEAGVRLVPVINRPPPVKLPPELEARLAATAALNNPKKSAELLPLPPPRLLRELRPAGPVPATASLRPKTIEQDPIEEQVSQSKSRKRKRGKKQLEAHPEAQAASPAAEQSPPVKRPRLRKSWVPTKAQHERESRQRHIQDIGERSRENFDVVRHHWPALKEGTDESAAEEWIAAANGMLEDFLSMKVFFPERDKHIKLRETDNPGRPYIRNVFSRQDEGYNPRDFLKIPFDDWHHVFVDLALIYAKSGEQDRCYKVVQDVLFAANVFYQDLALHRTSFALGIHCGLVFNDSQYLIDLARQMITDSEYRGPMTYQLFAAVNRFSFGSNWFSSGPSQKFMLRMVKLFDYLAMEHGDMKGVRDRMDWAAQKPSLETKAARMRTSGEPFPPEPDAGILTMYGHMVAVANHSHSSLPYYYRALALQPDNICINLSIAAMWVQVSMKRQTENRQHGITQGLAFLYRYYDLRTASGKASHIQEAEYNTARMWHYLGLNHLAVPAYEKVLALSEKVREENRIEGGSLELDAEDYATEAAFALQGIFALTGNLEAAHRIGERWLVL